MLHILIYFGTYRTMLVLFPTKLLSQYTKPRNENSNTTYLAIM